MSEEKKEKTNTVLKVDNLKYTVGVLWNRKPAGRPAKENNDGKQTGNR